MKILLQYSITIVLCLSAFNASASNDALIQKCEDHWHNIIASENQYKNILNKWLKAEDSCKNTGQYEYRLAVVYERLGDLDKANSTIEHGLSLDTPYPYYLNSSKLFFQFKYLVKTNEKRVSEFNKILNGFEALMKAKPNIETAYEQAANIELAIDKVDDAIKHASKALELNNNSWISMRVLVVSYYLKQNYSKAQPYITKAIEINESLMNDVDFMISSAWIYAKLNHIKTSEKVILALYERVPSVKNNRDFISVLNHVKQALKQ